MWFRESSLQNRIASALGDYTDAPDVFLHGAAMSVTATALGKRVFTSFAGRPLTPCLWLCLIGRSTRLRKTTTLELARRLFRAALPSSGVIHLPASCSFEGMIDALNSTAGQSERIGENRVATGWWVVNEFGSMLGNLKKRYNEAMTETLTDIYDVPVAITRTTRGAGEITLPQPCVNILTATTVDWLTRLLDESDVASGFLPRWCFLPASKKAREIPFPDRKPEFPAALLQEVAKVGSLEGQLHLTNDAVRRYTDWSVEFENRVRPVTSSVGREAFVGRMLPVVLKLAMASAVGAGAGLVEQEDIEHGIEFAEWSDGVIERLLDEELAFTRQEKRRNRVVQLLRANGRKMQRSDLLKASKLSVQEFDRVLDTLIATGALAETAGNGRSRFYTLREKERTPDEGATRIGGVA